MAIALSESFIGILLCKIIHRNRWRAARRCAQNTGQDLFSALFAGPHIVKQYMPRFNYLRYWRSRVFPMRTFFPPAGPFSSWAPGAAKEGERKRHHWDNPEPIEWLGAPE